MISRFFHYFVKRTPRFGKVFVVGTVATLADNCVLFLLVQGLHWSPLSANVPSLLAGMGIQFLGNRYLVFQGARERSMSHQVLGFTLLEFVAFPLNAVLYYVLLEWLSIPYMLARPMGTAIVFLGFSYPSWKWVFRGQTKTGLNELN